MSGFAIFSILGYMSQQQGIDIATVAESGTDVHLLNSSEMRLHSPQAVMHISLNSALNYRTYHTIKMLNSFFSL